MFSYESGAAIGFFIWIFQTVNLIVSLNSQLNKNLNKIGQRLSWITLTAKPMSHDELRAPIYRKIIKFLFVSLSGLISIGLSWFYILWVIAFYFYHRSKDYGAPEVIKNFRWKMKNQDLSRDQIILEFFKTTEKDLSKFESFKENFLADLKENELI